MARLEVEIGGTNDELKKILAESKIELSKFAKEANSSKFNIKFDTSGAKAAVDDAKAQQAIYRAELEKAKVATESQREATQRNRTALVAAQEATAQARKRLAELALEQKKSRTETVVATGSYREAQQRLTALGKTIREAEGGFNSTNKAIHAQIAEYNALNSRLKAFDVTMGNHQRNVGNYPQLLGAVSPGLGNLASSFQNLGAGGGPVALAAMGISSIATAFDSAKKTIFGFNDGLLNVSKTTGMSGRELEDMSDEVIKLSKSLKVVGTPQLLEYATVAGQLGVKGKANILSFAEALAKLEVASNIKGEEGGAEIARLLTLTDGGVQNVKSFGDEIVNLGNNFAATEKEILGNAEAIAQNVGLYNIGRQDILAFATATKSVGLEAEVVGSSFGRTLAVLEKAIRTGNGLSSVLATVGGTQAELSKRFKQDAAGVFVDFVGGLNKINASGGNTKMVLENLGIAAVRDQRVIESLAVKGFDTLSRSLDTVKNSAGAMESEFSTASGKLIQQTGRIGIAWDNLILSIDNGTGAIGVATVKTAGFFADLLDQISKVVTSSSWQEFFGQIGGGNIAASGITSNLAGVLGAVANNKETAKRGLVGYSDMKDFYRAAASEQQRMINLQKQSVELRSKEYQADKSVKNLKELNYQAEMLAKMYAKTGKAAEAIIPKTETVDGVALEEKSAKTKAQIAAARKESEAREKAERSTYIASLDEYSAKIEQIKDKFQELYKTGLSGDFLGLAKANEQMETSKIQADKLFGSISKIQKVGSITIGAPNLIPSTPLKLSGSQSPLTGLSVEGKEAFKKWLDEELGKSDDKATNRISKQVEQAFTRGIGDILDNITDLGSDFYDVFSNVFSKLAGTVNNVFTTALTASLSKSINEKMSSDDFNFAGLSSGVSKAVLAGAGIAGSLVSSMSKKTDAVGQAAGTGLSLAGAGGGIGSLISKSGGIWGAAIGGAIGIVSGIFGASKARKEEELQKKALEEQKKQTLLLERANALAFQSSITGQMTNQGVITSVDRNAFGDLTATIKGQDIVLAVKRTEESASRGY